jgi:formylglycine-generating enzyme required for sulfatase activity
MGSSSEEFPDAQPVRDVFVDGFWMDETEVTNAAYARFVDATGYVTVAERQLDPKDFPGAPPELLVPGAVVFAPPDGAVPLDSNLRWWSYVPGASWKNPTGPASNLDGREDEPVVNVAYEDATAYADWAGKRLPTEAEWERAARGGLAQKPFVWGDEFTPGGKFLANTFQGHFPEKHTSADGFAGVAPVRSYPPNAYGLHDVAGNVWEWVSDWYRFDTYAKDAAKGPITVNPTGPVDSFDPAEPVIPKRVQKGGSFLCTNQYCSRYQPGGRGKGDVSTGTNHLGFRCVKIP